MCATPSKPKRVALEPAAALAAALRGCLGRFVTGVAVVTFESPPGNRRGITVDSFTSVSLDPPLILVSIAKTARCHDPLASGCALCVNVLGAEQEVLARAFARSREDLAVERVEGLHAPGLPGVLARFECEPWRCYDGGDHTLVLGRIIDFTFRDGDALGFYTSRFAPVADRHLGHEDLI